jgi:hypothetical protein
MDPSEFMPDIRIETRVIRKVLSHISSFVSIQKRHLTLHAGVLGLFLILDVAPLRLRSKKPCGLGLNRNLPFLDGHYLMSHRQFPAGP